MAFSSINVYTQSFPLEDCESFMHPTQFPFLTSILANSAPNYTEKPTGIQLVALLGIEKDIIVLSFSWKMPHCDASVKKVISYGETGPSVTLGENSAIPTPAQQHVAILQSKLAATHCASRNSFSPTACHPASATPFLICQCLTHSCMFLHWFQQIRIVRNIFENLYTSFSTKSAG